MSIESRRSGSRPRNARLFVLYTVTQYTPLYWAYMYHLVVEVRGLSSSQFGVLKAIYYLSVALLEVPLGVVADRIGRKSTLALGAGFNAAGCLVYVVATDFAMFAAAEMCFAFATACVSGASSALLYDSLRAESRQEDYARWEGRGRGAALLTSSLAFPLTDLFLVRGDDPTLAYAATAVISAAGIVSALAMIEPPRERQPARRIALGALRDVLDSRALVGVLLYSGTLFILMRAANALFFNPVLSAAGLPVSSYGTVMAVVGVLGALTAWRTHDLMRAPKAALFALPLLLVAIYGGLALSGGSLAVAILVAHGLVIGAQPVLVATLMNANIQSSQNRATVLSFESLVSRGLYSVAAVALGFGLQVARLEAVLGFTAALGLLPIVLAWRLQRAAPDAPSVV